MVQLFGMFILYLGPVGLLLVIKSQADNFSFTAFNSNIFATVSTNLFRDEMLVGLLFVVAISLGLLTLLSTTVRKNIKVDNMMQRFSVFGMEALCILAIFSINFEIIIVMPVSLLITTGRYFGCRIFQHQSALATNPIFNVTSILVILLPLVLISEITQENMFSLLISIAVGYRVYSNSLPNLKRLYNVYSK